MFIAALLSFLPRYSNAQNLTWQQTNGPDGGRLGSIFAVDSLLFASSEGGGVFRSSNEGNSWVSVGKQFYGLEAGPFASVGAMLFLGTGSDVGSIPCGAYRSTDFGNSWTLTMKGIPAGSAIDDFAVTNGVIVAISGGIIYRSTDTGISWAKLDTIGWGALSWHFAVRDSTIFLATGGDGVFRSSDQGDSWVQIEDSVMGSYFEGFAIIDSTFFALSDYWLFRSTDDGMSWTQLDINNVFSIGGDRRTVFAGTYDQGLFQSTDNGDTWTEDTIGLPASSFFAFAQSDLSTLVASAAGIFKTTNRGSAWQESDDGIVYSSIQSLASANTNIYAGTAYGGLFLSTDGGNSWQRKNNGMNAQLIDAIATTGDKVFAAGSFGGMFLSRDSGDSWSQINGDVFSTYQTAGALLADSNFVIAATGSSLYRTTDDGSTWIQIDSGLPSQTFRALASSTGAIFALGDNAYRSIDNGDSWMQIDSVGYAESIATDGSNVVIHCPEGFLQSTNDGESWELISSQLDSLDIVSLVITNSIYVAYAQNNVPSQDFGVFISLDQGKTWTKTEDGLDGHILNPMIQVGNYIYGGTQWGGVFRTTTPSIVESTNNDLELNPQLYPNPSTGACTLVYQVDGESFIQVAIYDVAGNQVRVVSSEYEGEGQHTISLGTESLPSGNYVCQVRVGDRVCYINLVITK